MKAARREEHCETWKIEQRNQTCAVEKTKRAWTRRSFAFAQHEHFGRDSFVGTSNICPTTNRRRRQLVRAVSTGGQRNRCRAGAAYDVLLQISNIRSDCRTRQAGSI